MTPVFSNQPYLLLAVELDAEWSRKRAYELPQNDHPLSGTFKKIDAVCAKYRNGIENVLRQFRHSTGDEVGSGLERHLFKPLYFLPSGHADCLALILVDDYDAVHHVAAHSRTIEDLTLAFCPAMDSLGLEGVKFLVEPHQMWEREHPVLTLTKFKIDGLCTLDYGLLFKRAIFRAIALRCQEALIALDDASKASGTVSAGDLKSVTVTILCLQGQEEIGLLISSTNPSVNFGLASAVRTLCVRDILKDESDRKTHLLRTLLEASPANVPKGRNGYRHGDLHRFLFQKECAPNADSVRSPVFRWSRSLLSFGLAGGETLAPHPAITGKVAVDIDFQLAPGLDAALGDCMEFRQPTAEIPVGWHLGEVGTSDHRLSLAGQRQLVNAIDAVRHICDCVSSTVRHNREKRTSGLVGMLSTFLIPIPTRPPFISNEKVEESPLDKLLPKMGAKVISEQASVEGLDLALLKNVPKSYGLPRALRRSLEALFQNFVTAIFNPNLFDLVADLVDAFSTLHQVLTVSLPSALRDSSGNSLQIDEVRVLGLARYATALKNAVERRLDLAYPDATVRNMSVQFPGSFAQILFAADAPLKACLGILKYHVKHKKDKDSINPDSLLPLFRVGVVTEPTLAPGIRCDDMVLNLTGPAESVSAVPRLAFLQMDVDHLFHVGSYFDYAHEAFHLVFDELFLKSPSTPEAEVFGKLLAYEDSSSTRERLEETWVHIACFLFFAPDKPRELLYYLIGKYCQDMRSGGPELPKTVRFFAEQVSRLTVAAALVEHQLDKDETTLNDSIFQKSFEMLEESLDFFIRLLPEASELNDSKLKQAIREQLKVYWRECHLDAYLTPMWKTAKINFYDRLCNDLTGFSKEHRSRNMDSLDCLANGWAITRHAEDGYMDSVAGTAILLGSYLTRFKLCANSRQRLHLDRDELGNVFFAENVDYSTFLIDRGSSQRFVCEPKDRADRLRHQIGLLESFWDFSSHFRARRILALLQGDLPKPR